MSNCYIEGMTPFKLIAGAPDNSLVAVLTKVVPEKQKTIEAMSRKMANLERKVNEKGAFALAAIPSSGKPSR